MQIKVILQYFIISLIHTGTTTVLTMTFLALDTRDELPRVTYATALDLYVAMCFIFVLSTLVQFAIVHLFTKKGHSDTCTSPPYVDSSDDENVPVSLFLLSSSYVAQCMNYSTKVFQADIIYGYDRHSFLVF